MVFTVKKKVLLLVLEHWASKVKMYPCTRSRATPASLNTNNIYWDLREANTAAVAVANKKQQNRL